MKKNIFINPILPIAILFMSFMPGKTPSLKEAVMSQNIAKMKELLDAGADPNEKNSGSPMIYWASISGNCDMIKLLVEKGAEVDMTGMTGLTALYGLIDNCKEPQQLLDDNKKANEKLINRVKGDTAKVAQWLAHEDINRFSTVADKVRTILDLKADPNFLEGNGTVKIGTPFLRAVEKQDLSLVKILLDSKKVDTELRFDQWAESTLRIVHKMEVNEYEKYDRKDAKAWASIPQYNTPLIFAVEKQNLELVKLLVEGGADINNGKKRVKGDTYYYLSPLDIAMEKDNKEIIDYLKSKGGICYQK